MKKRKLLYLLLALLLLPVATTVWLYLTQPEKAYATQVPDWDQYLLRVTTAERVGADQNGVFPGTPLSLTGKVPRDLLADSEVCGQSGCHPDLVRQWRSSMHHLASFNNPFYTKSVRLLRQREGDAAVRWCAGCHDAALLLSGHIDGPVGPKTPAADAGVTCVLCHSTVGVQELTGNGRYTVYVHDTRFLRPGHPLRPLVGLLLKVFPRPHKRGFLKPLHRDPEFCSSCHRVGLSLAQNHYRWLRGQDQFGGWLNGGASGRVARSLYTPRAALRCQDCHMPLVSSQDAGNRDGKVHLHAFPGANTAVPTLLGMPEQAALTEALLKGSMRVDIVAAREEAPVHGNRPRTVWHLPLETARLPPGRDLLLDIVVRNLRVGHGFPEGVLDNKQVWLEVAATDAGGQVRLGSGGLDGKGELLPGTHPYGAVLLDAAGRRIDRRNINDFRAGLFRRVLGPGQSDIARFRLRVPEGAVGPLQIVERLRYRKVQPDYVRWTFADRSLAGEEGEPPQPVPELPVVEVARDEIRVALATGGGAGNGAGAGKAALAERLNDYGIGFLLQQDFGKARHVFAELADKFPDLPLGLVGQARVALAEGDDQDAVRALVAAQELLARRPALLQEDRGVYPRIMGLLGQALLGRGDYEQADRALNEALALYPQDRSLFIDLGAVRFQREDYEGAIAAYRRALELDPDDGSAHSMLARIFKALGREKDARREERTFEAMRDDVANDGAREKYLQAHPQEALEVVSGHEHPLLPLP